jgi:hypothetical protein
VGGWSFHSRAGRTVVFADFDQVAPAPMMMMMPDRGSITRPLGRLQVCGVLCRVNVLKVVEGKTSGGL